MILKPNRGGKGLGVRLFHTADALADYLSSQDYEPPIDGLHLLQQYVRAPTPMITRAEFVGGKFMYAVEVDTSEGFETVPGGRLRIAERPSQVPHHRCDRAVAACSS